MNEQCSQRQGGCPWLLPNAPQVKGVSAFDDLDSRLSLDSGQALIPWNGIGKLGRFGCLAEIGQHAERHLLR